MQCILEITKLMMELRFSVSYYSWYMSVRNQSESANLKNC
jgi:hypothetical protein